MNNLETMKDIFFEIYSAGYEQGYVQNKDLATAYKKWWDIFIKQFEEVVYDNLERAATCTNY